MPNKHKQTSNPNRIIVNKFLFLFHAHSSQETNNNNDDHKPMECPHKFIYLNVSNGKKLFLFFFLFFIFDCRSSTQITMEFYFDYKKVLRLMHFFFSFVFLYRSKHSTIPIKTKYFDLNADRITYQSVCRWSETQAVRDRESRMKK